MTGPGAADRLRVADRLQAARDEIAARLTERWFAGQPGYADRYREAERRTREDFGYIVDFLGSAVAAGSAAGFVHFVRWTSGVLAARSVPAEDLAEGLGMLRSDLMELPDLPQAETVADYLDRGLEALEATTDAAPAGAGTSGGLADEQSVYLQAILGGDRRAALTVVRELLRTGCERTAPYLELIQPAMYEVGRLWESNRITVADEHLATTVTQYVLTRLYDELEISAPTRGRAVIAGVEGELHQLGAHMVADVLEADGWNVRFLGADVPDDSLLAAIEDHDCDVVGVSATTLKNVPRVARLISEVRRRFGERPRFVLGGGAFRHAPELWREVGADGCGADLGEAVEITRSLSAPTD